MSVSFFGEFLDVQSFSKLSILTAVLISCNSNDERPYFEARNQVLLDELGDDMYNSIDDTNAESAVVSSPLTVDTRWGDITISDPGGTFFYGGHEFQYTFSTQPFRVELSSILSGNEIIIYDNESDGIVIENGIK